MEAFCVCMVLSLFVMTLTSGEDCDTIDGIWTNQHGSTMTLSHTTQDKLTGKYKTAVSSDGSTEGDILGAAPYNTPGATFGFLVMWGGGTSTTVWTGQCHVCEGQAVLMTSWLLRTKQNTCLNQWKAVQIGQDSFRRPTIPPTTRTPISSTKHERKKLDIDGFLHGIQYAARHRNVRHANHARTEQCHLPGDWYNGIGSRVHAVDGGLGLLSGDYWTAREVQAGKLSGTHSSVYGQYNTTTHANHTVGFFIFWNNGKSVTAWIGQCHMCNVNSTKTEVLETTWFHRIQVTSCHANWKSTLYGQASFTHVPRPVNPDDDVSGEFGEDDALCIVNSAQGAPCRSATTLLLVGIAAGLLMRVMQ